MAGAVKHDYHLVDPSPWPITGSISAMIMMLGAVTWAHSGANEGGLQIGGTNADGEAYFALQGAWIFFLGLAGVLFTMVGWWRDVVKESLNGENTKPVIRIGFRYGMVLFIASEVMFFAAWFWAFFGAALFPGAGDAITLADGTQMLNASGDPAYLMNDARFHATDGVWPPVGVEPLSAWQLPLINTLILLLSGTTVTWAHHAIVIGDRNGFLQGLAITVVLGAFFSFLQFVEYYEAIAGGLFSFSGGIYGGSFFMATGFHGLHVIIGTIFLAVCFLRGLANQLTPDRHFGFEAAAWYWHFVDVVWLFLFAFIYVLGNQGLLS